MASESGPERSVDRPVNREAEEADELMRRSAEGDQIAFRRIVERYRGFVIAVCRSEDSQADAEDLAQIALIKAWERSHTYRGGGKLKSWLAAIARNSTKDERRKRRRRREASLDELMEAKEAAPSFEPVSTEIGTEDAAISATYRAAIDEAFAVLNENQGKVMRLLLFEGMHYREISEATGIKPNTVKTTIHRAREKMMAHLREQGIDWPP